VKSLSKQGTPCGGASCCLMHGIRHDTISAFTANPTIDMVSGMANVLSEGGKMLKAHQPRLQACNPIVALIQRQSTVMPPTKTSRGLSTELLIPLLPNPHRRTSIITIPQSFPTSDTLSLEDIPKPPGLFSPDYEDIYPLEKPRPFWPHQPTLNTITPENTPENNLGVHYFSIY